MKNLIIISLDCVKKESLSCYNDTFHSLLHRTIGLFNFRGIGLFNFIIKSLFGRLLRFFIKPNTFFIDKIAHDGIIFTEAFTAAPFTPAAHACLFTGLNPYNHGIRKMVGLKLNKQVITLAEALKKNGYSTGGFLGSNALGKEYGLDKGFDIYEFTPGELSCSFGDYKVYRRDCQKVTDNALDWLSKVKNNKFLLFVHYFDAHEENTNMSYQPFWQINKMKNIDRQIGRIIEFLKRNNLYNDSIIVILSDHGNSFGEHHEETHREYLYDSTLRIPMIIKFDSTFKNRVSSLPVCIIDIFPTVMGILEFNFPGPKALDGINILDVIDNKNNYKPVIYAETCIEKSISNPDDLKSRHLSIRKSNFKIILETMFDKIEAFDVKDDPYELNNIYQNHFKAIEELYEMLLKLISLDNKNNSNKMTQEEFSETKKVLKSLGYL